MPMIVIPPPLDFLSLVRGRALVCFPDFDWQVASTAAWTKSSVKDISCSRAVFERRFHPKPCVSLGVQGFHYANEINNGPKQ